MWTWRCLSACQSQFKDIREHAGLHWGSITSSATSEQGGWHGNANALAVVGLIVSTYLVGACTGRSAGFSPFTMRSM